MICGLSRQNFERFGATQRSWQRGKCGMSFILRETNIVLETFERQKEKKRREICPRCIRSEPLRTHACTHARACVCAYPIFKHWFNCRGSVICGTFPSLTLHITQRRELFYHWMSLDLKHITYVVRVAGSSSHLFSLFFFFSLLNSLSASELLRVISQIGELGSGKAALGCNAFLTKLGIQHCNWSYALRPR